jgi:hypothetical protein
MAEYITLMGAEQVSSAGYTMRDAAQKMNQAAGEFESVLFRHHQFMDDWLQRFERILEVDREERK